MNWKELIAELFGWAALLAILMLASGCVHRDDEAAALVTPPAESLPRQVVEAAEALNGPTPPTARPTSVPTVATQTKQLSQTVDDWSVTEERLLEITQRMIRRNHNPSTRPATRPTVSAVRAGERSAESAGSSVSHQPFTPR